MSTHYDDEAQVEQLRRWWKENWLALAGGLAVGLIAIFGWQGYTAHRDARAAQASQMFEDLKKALASSKLDEAKASGDKLAKDYEGTPYAAAGALKLAQAAVDSGRVDEAVPRLQWVQAHSDDAGLKSLAQLRLARVYWQQGKADEALKALDGLDKSYVALAAELRGDIKLSQGDRAAAYSAYQDALTKNPDESAAAKAGLQRKLDNLADAATVKS